MPGCRMPAARWPFKLPSSKRAEALQQSCYAATLAKGVIQVYNPAAGPNGGVLSTVPCDSEADVQGKVSAALQSHKAWSKAPLEQRVAVLLEAARLLKAEAAGLAQMLTRETGKPISQARMEVLASAQRISGVASMVRELQLQEPAPLAGASKKQHVRWEPVGAVLDISTWNYPLLLASGIHTGALLLGNAVLYKPSEHAILTALRYVELMHQAGVPSKLLAPFVGGATVAQQLLQQPGLGVVCFTGSHEHGRQVAQAAAAQLVPCHLELGGRDMAYVHSDVPDVGRVAKHLADSAFANSGQTCCAIKHVLVHEDVLREFCDRIKAHVQAYRVGDPTNPSTFIGPLCLSHATAKLAAQVHLAVSHGAQLLVPSGERHHKPATTTTTTTITSVQPAVLLADNYPAELLSQESFGPVLLLQPVPSPAAAVSLMAGSRHGLTAAVFSADEALAEELLGRLDVGTAFWNHCGEMDFRLPWSGRKASGMGMVLGKAGLQQFLRPKSFCMVRPAAASAAR